MSKIFKRLILKDLQVDLFIIFLAIFITLSISNLGFWSKEVLLKNPKLKELVAKSFAIKVYFSKFFQGRNIYVS